jgi:hypothetical protein
MPSDVGSTPQLEAPTLADLYRRMINRPTWQTAEKLPLEVDPDTFERGLSELRMVLADQGRALAVADWIKRENFLLYGCPVVKAA